MVRNLTSDVDKDLIIVLLLTAFSLSRQFVLRSEIRLRRTADSCEFLNLLQAIFQQLRRYAGESTGNLLPKLGRYCRFETAFFLN